MNISFQNKKLTCLQADVLVNIFVSCVEHGFQYGNENRSISENALLNDYSLNVLGLPSCCFTSSTACNGNKYKDEFKHYTEEQIKLLLKHTLLQLKNKGLLKSQNQKYYPLISYDDAKFLAQKMSDKCQCMKAYVKDAYSYLLEEQPSNDNKKSNPNTEASKSSFIQKNIAEDVHNKDWEFIKKAFSQLSVVMMDQKKNKRRFEPVYICQYQNENYIILNPLFNNAFGDNAGLVFKKNYADQTYSVIIDKELTSKIFELYYSALRENGGNK